MRESQVRIRMLNPPHKATAGSSNDTSLALHLSCGRFSALLAGDMEKGAEARLLASTRDAGSLLLKVAHHGSRTGTTEDFVRAVRPRWSVISAGRNNPFGHPSPEVVRRLLRHGSRPLLTTDLGAITFETDGERYRLKSHVCGLIESGSLPERESR